MNVIPEISKNGWRVLLTLAVGPATALEVAKKYNMRPNSVTDALDQFQEYHIIKQRKRRRPISIDSSLKNVLHFFLKRYSEEHLVGSFSGKKLNTLFQILHGYDTVEKMKFVTGYSVPTIKRSLKVLRKNLFVFQPKKATYQIRDEFVDKINELYSSFFAYFVVSLDMEWKEAMVFGNIILLKCVETPPGFFKTGLSRFHEYGVELIETENKYFASFKPTKEEIFIHALAFGPQDTRNLMFCLLFADKNRMNKKRLQKLATIYLLETEVDAILEFLETKGKKKAEFLPAYQEYLSMRRLYG